MNFVPSHATAVILYGQEACRRLGGLLKYWNTILGRDDWNQYVFVMIDQDPPVPEIPAQARHVSSNILKMTPEELKFAGYPENIVKKLQNRIQNNTVCLQLVMSFDSPCEDSPEHLTNWIGSIQDAFGPGELYTICYLLCGSRDYQQKSQGDIARILQEKRSCFPYVYLLGDCMQDSAAVQDDLLWRAVHSEVLINSSDIRKLTRYTPYSLGYSALNANNQELEALRLQAAVEYLQKEAEQPILLQTAWDIITQRSLPLSGLTSAELFPVVRTWLDQIVAQHSVFPTETERKNNRAFTGLTMKSVSPQDVQKSIERFYYYNCGLQEETEREQAQFTRTQKQQIFAQLSGRADAGAFPMKLIDAVERELETLLSVSVSLSLPAWPSKGIFMSNADYINRQCDAIEGSLRQYYQAVQRKRYAQSLLEILKAVRAYAENAKTLPDELDKVLAQLHMPQRLDTKYPKYADQVFQTITAKHGQLFIAAAGRNYFDPQGFPIREEWRENVGKTAKAIDKNLPPQCVGPFYKIIKWEFSTGQDLNSFFGNYLAGSKRMLKENFDTPGSVQSLYITDDALSANNWAQSNRNSVIAAHNDNVERIDLFALQKDLPWYIDNNRYFQVKDTPQSGSHGGPVPVFDSQPIPADSDADAQQSDPDEPDADARQEETEHNIYIHFVNNRYILTWDWEPNANQAVVTISQPQGLGRSIPCSVKEFNNSVGGVPNGIDITDNLPYGKVTIEISSLNGAYAKKDLNGKRRGVTYRFDRNQNGIVLKVKGRSDDIRKLFVKERRDNNLEQFVLYPLNVRSAKTETTVTGFTLRDLSACTLVTDPSESYPIVYAERY